MLGIYLLFTLSLFIEKTKFKSVGKIGVDLYKRKGELFTVCYFFVKIYLVTLENFRFAETCLVMYALERKLFVNELFNKYNRGKCAEKRHKQHYFPLSDRVCGLILLRIPLLRAERVRQA